ncbi:MAG: hypothetical protein EOP54_17065 [Sphingobacteriales bacterium]|nr:MAG: hypothetical protein EOP54_17065 [Sphingobacteriales bacterium]
MQTNSGLEHRDHVSVFLWYHLFTSYIRTLTTHTTQRCSDYNLINIEQSLAQVEEIQNLCVKNNKKALLYISMGFGNPYGDEYNADIVFHWFRKLVELGVEHIALADTVGVSNPENIDYIFSNLIPEFPDMHIGAHFHSHPHNWEEKILAAWNSGCRSFDSSIKGIGGCPMAKDELVGNIATENMLLFAHKHKIPLKINDAAFNTAAQMAVEVFV